MRKSGEKTTAAKLRQICAISDSEMAKHIDRSVHTIHSIESGRLKLSKEVATRMARETGVSLKWLLDGDTLADATDVNGKRYTRDVYDRTQARKIPYPKPHELLRYLFAAGFVGRMIAILEGSTDWSMCAYKVHTALESLRREFGQNQTLYLADPRATKYGTNISQAMPLLEKLMDTCKKYDVAMKKWDELDQAKLEQSKLPLKKRRRKA